MMQIAAMEFRRVVGRHAVLATEILALSVAWYLFVASLPRLSVR
jgi:hypothetical protein